MELSQLKYFLAVAESLKVTRTAERLHIAQPSLTRSIKNLEKELGVALFAKKGRSIELTECGVYMKNRVEPFLKALEKLPSELSDMDEREKSTVRMNVHSASYIVTQSIITYKKDNRMANFKLLQSGDMEESHIDIDTAPVYEGSTGEDTYVFHEDIYMAVSPASPYASMPFVRLKDLEKEDFISLSDAKQLRSICDGFCRRAGFVPAIVFESENPAAVKNLIAADVGIGFLPNHTWGELTEDGVVMLPIKEPECKRDIVVKLRQRGGEAEKYFKHLIEYMDGLKKKG